VTFDTCTKRFGLLGTGNRKKEPDLSARKLVRTMEPLLEVAEEERDSGQSHQPVYRANRNLFSIIYFKIKSSVNRFITNKRNLNDYIVSSVSQSRSFLG
jgi:hypothetical protein